MNYFTPEEMEPSEKVLSFIRQFARAYRVNRNGASNSMCYVN